MAGFSSLKALIDASEVTGNIKYATWRKTPTQTTASGFWFDLSMSPGNPPPQYYAATPKVSIALAQSTDGGLPHGENVSPSSKYLRRIMALTTTATVVPCPMILMDYLMYYPFVDEGDTGVQTLTNSITIPRYTNYTGIQMMAVVQAGQAGGGPDFQVTYTNQDNIQGRVSSTVRLNTQVATGTIVTTATATATCFGPFIPLQSGDTGVKSIQSVQMNTADIGLFALVLVKPLCQMSIRGIDAPVELDPFLNCGGRLPEIKDDAFLSFICSPGGTLSAAPIHGDITIIWT